MGEGGRIGVRSTVGSSALWIILVPLTVVSCVYIMKEVSLESQRSGKGIVLRSGVRGEAKEPGGGRERPREGKVMEVGL